VYALRFIPAIFHFEGRAWYSGRREMAVDFGTAKNGRVSE